MELTALPPKKNKPTTDHKKRSQSSSGWTFSQPQSRARPQFAPQGRSSYAGFGMQGSNSGTPPQRKTSLFHYMTFNSIIEERQNESPLKNPEFGLNPNICDAKVVFPLPIRPVIETISFS